MQEDLGKNIADLLYRHDRLNIPGLGSFELSHAPALVDQVQGQITAPAKAILFNENLVMDDGVLVAHLQRTNNWSLAETQQWVKEQVDQIKTSLQNKEIVELPGVGRFFRNFEQQLKFVAESGNFNIDTFGLRPVKGQLIARSREEKIPVAQHKKAVAPVKTKTSKTIQADSVAGDIATWFQKNLVWVLALTVIVLIAAAILLFNRPDDPVVISDPVAEVPQERLNASPSKTTPAPEENEIAPPPAESELPPHPAEDIGEDFDTEASTLAPEEHTAVIAVGLFGDPNNVQNLMEELSKDGYAPVSKREGNNTRIGVSIRFTEEAELQSALSRVRRKYAKSAFLLSRDGKSLQ